MEPKFPRKELPSIKRLSLRKVWKICNDIEIINKSFEINVPSSLNTEFRGGEDNFHAPNLSKMDAPLSDDSKSSKYATPNGFGLGFISAYSVRNSNFDLTN